MVGGFDIALWALLVIATITDLRWGKIFNATTLPFFSLGIAFRFFYAGVEAGSQSLLAVLVAVALFFPLYFLKVLAAGDVKLLMAIGAWTEPKLVIHLAGVSIVFGAMVGLLVLFRQVGFKGGAKSVAEHAKLQTPTRSTRMPFAPAFLCGFMILKIAESYQWFVI